MTPRLPNVDWERQGWNIAGPEVPYEGHASGRYAWSWAALYEARQEALRQAQGTVPLAQSTGYFGPSIGSGLDPSSARHAESADVRIGDVERDQAISALGDHFAAGRLTRDEFDERSDQVMQARYGRDLQPVFADLPAPVRLLPPQRSRPYPGPRFPLFALAPLLMIIAVVTAVVLSAPWVIWGLLTFFLLSGFWGRRFGPRHHHRQLR